MTSNSNLFGSLTRIFNKSESDDSQQTIGRNPQRSPPSPVYYPAGLNRATPSLTGGVTPERTRPSQVSWITPTTASPSPNGSVSPLRFAGQSSDEEDSSAVRRANTGFRISTDSEFLRMQSARLSGTSSAGSAAQRKSSPITDDRPQFPILRGPSLDTVPSTPTSTRLGDGTLHVSHSTAFINRPLKRTISQGSTSTFRTVVSVNAPSIPPVDVRPNFASSLGVAPGAGRRPDAQHASVPGARPNPTVTVSVIYEDSLRTISFITARSAHDTNSDPDLERGPEEPDEYDLGTASGSFNYDEEHDDEDDVTPDTTPEGGRHPSPYGYNRAEGTDEYSHMSLPSDFYDIELNPTHRTPNADSPPSRVQGYSTPSILETISRRSRSAASDATAVETAIQRRWLRGLSFGSYRTERGQWGAKDDSARGAITSACILFFVGFFAPWCWLIGGWYLSTSGEIKPDGQYLQTVPWKWPRRRRARNVVKPPKADVKLRYTLSPFWRSRVQETMPMSPVDSRASITSLRSLKKEEVVFDIDPWVVRCRIAAVISGLLLAAGIIVVLVVLAGLRI